MTKLMSVKSFERLVERSKSEFWRYKEKIIDGVVFHRTGHNASHDFWLGLDSGWVVLVSSCLEPTGKGYEEMWLSGAVEGYEEDWVFSEPRLVKSSDYIGHW